MDNQLELYSSRGSLRAISTVDQRGVVVIAAAPDHKYMENCHQAVGTYDLTRSRRIALLEAAIETQRLLLASRCPRDAGELRYELIAAVVRRLEASLAGLLVVDQPLPGSSRSTVSEERAA